MTERLAVPAELLRRYRAIFVAAWAARRELAGPARLADESAFLPAALAIQDTPMHPSPRRTAAVLIALAVIALAWTVFGRVDIVAIAPGRLIVSERVKLVQPLERSVVRAILVRDGDHVSPGQLLVALDPTGASADLAGLDEQRLAVDGERMLARALTDALEGGRPPAFEAPSSWPPLRRDATARRLQAEWQDLQARLGRIDAEAARRRAERATIQATALRLGTALRLSQRREDDLRALAGAGFASTHAWEDRRRERLDLDGELGTQHARLREAEAALDESRRARDAALAEARRRWREALAQAEPRLAQLEAERRKATRREQLTRLTAPVAGTVQQLAAHTPGGIVTEAQTLMVIVPDDAPVTAEVMLDNKDIGFVRVGDTAAVKLDTFPFTRHGTLPATVTRISADAVDDEQRGPLFAATLTLADRAIDIDGTRVPLRPGMALSAEVRTGSRRVIEFLLSPIERTSNESLRER
ncbi:hemolysin activation protein [Roseateles aquatilis]|uniref:Membrane fusion protein (MFP) family protein n=1 Tax=Roseateles aquatilis TaxID=431061 RepID=A0A246J8Z6_9BURK|nr:hemolysin activation protein [Roseateles aquatilis]